MTGNYQVTKEQLEEYGRNGHIILHDVLTLQEIREIVERVDGMLSGKYGTDGFIAGEASNNGDNDPGRLIKQVMPMEYPIRDSILRHYSEHPVLKSIVCQLMQVEDAKMFQQQALIKEPGYPNGTPWHQDDYYWKLSGPGITAWFPLEPVSAQNGTMSVFPGTHTWAILNHEKSNGVSAFHTIDQHVDETKAVPVVLPLGSVSFHHKNLIHGAFANKGSARRIALAQHYAAIVD